MKKPGAEVALLTNCRLFSNEKYINKLVEARPVRFKVVTTLYGHNSILHDNITKTPGSFQQQINGIRNLIKYGIFIEEIAVSFDGSTELYDDSGPSDDFLI